MGEACLVAFFCLMLGRKDRTYNTKAKPPMCGRLTRGSMSVRLSYLNLAFFVFFLFCFFYWNLNASFFFSGSFSRSGQSILFGAFLYVCAGE